MGFRILEWKIIYPICQRHIRDILHCNRCRSEVYGLTPADINTRCFRLSLLFSLTHKYRMGIFVGIRFPELRNAYGDILLAIIGTLIWSRGISETQIDTLISCDIATVVF